MKVIRVHYYCDGFHCSKKFDAETRGVYFMEAVWKGTDTSACFHFCSKSCMEPVKAKLEPDMDWIEIRQLLPIITSEIGLK